ncbi:hypothetical protein PFLUV_G00005000 [Perca fluviatilis]|uniref:Uncharacterized protein n=1 Tax=Perca fluviatilis TaxID=8168 RepID=A0A6A5FNF8_PERFL|nr:hypothetical protein PFLUV_G00005000 [Perca fluviatilis]
MFPYIKSPGSSIKGPLTIHHGRTRRRNPASVHWIRKVLQRIHNHRKEELCFGHICQHTSHWPFLQIEAQKTGRCHREVIMCLF